MTLLESPASFSPLVAPAIDFAAISVHNFVDKEKVAALRGENPAALALFAGPLTRSGMSQDEYNELAKYEHSIRLPETTP